MKLVAFISEFQSMQKNEENPPVHIQMPNGSMMEVSTIEYLGEHRVISIKVGEAVQVVKPPEPEPPKETIPLIVSSDIFNKNV